MKTLVIFYFLVMVQLLSAQPMIVAHRGASYLAPENTVASAKLAWELGADAVEVDVHLSKDNRVMVIHDKDTKRTCSAKKNLKIDSTPSVLLRDLDAGEWKDQKFKGEKIPFLSEIINTVPENKTLIVEIKCGSEIVPHLAQVIEKSGKGNQIIFISFGWKTILDVKDQFPDNSCYWLSENKTGLKSRLSDAAEAGLDGINLNYKLIDEEIMNLAKSNNLEVYAWTIDDPQEAKRLANLGVLAITTNRPGWLKEQLAFPGR